VRSTKLIPDIKIINNFISDSEAREWVDYIDKHCEDPKIFTKHIGQAYDRGDVYRSNVPNDFAPSVHPKPLMEKLYDYARRAETVFREYYKYNGKPLYIEGISLTKLTPGLQLRMHKDQHGIHPTVCSSVLYLNDDFEGGKIAYLSEFERKSNFDLYTEDLGGFVYDPVPGDITIFPSQTWHGTTEVTSGSRYAIVIWHTTAKAFSLENSMF
jgi:hypothetical protein